MLSAGLLCKTCLGQGFEPQAEGRRVGALLFDLLFATCHIFFPCKMVKGAPRMGPVSIVILAISVEEIIFIELTTSDHKLKASREGSE